MLVLTHREVQGWLPNVSTHFLVLHFYIQYRLPWNFCFAISRWLLPIVSTSTAQVDSVKASCATINKCLVQNRRATWAALVAEKCTTHKTKFQTSEHWLSASIRNEETMSRYTRFSCEHVKERGRKKKILNREYPSVIYFLKDKEILYQIIAKSWNRIFWPNKVLPRLKT